MVSEGKKNCSKLNAPGRIFTLKKQKPKTYFPNPRAYFSPRAFFRKTTVSGFQKISNFWLLQAVCLPYFSTGRLVSDSPSQNWTLRFVNRTYEQNRSADTETGTLLLPVCRPKACNAASSVRYSVVNKGTQWTDPAHRRLLKTKWRVSLLFWQPQKEIVDKMV